VGKIDDPAQSCSVDIADIEEVSRSRRGCLRTALGLTL